MENVEGNYKNNHYSTSIYNQGDLQTTVGKLTLRVAELEEYNNKLSRKVAKMMDRLPVEGAPLPSEADAFPRHYFRHMMTSLGLPGARFIGERCHTFLWIFIHVAALLTSYSFIKEEYDNWQSSPVVRTLSNHLTSVDTIPFPAITICLSRTLNESYDFEGNLKKCFLCNNTDENSTCEFNEMCTFEEKATLALAYYNYPPNRDNKTTTNIPLKVFVNNIQKSIKNEDISLIMENVFPPCKVNFTQAGYSVDGPYPLNHFYQSGIYGNGYNYFEGYRYFCFTINGLRHEDMYKESVVVTSPRKSKNSLRENYIGQNLTLENMIDIKGNITTVPAYITNDQIIQFGISDPENKKVKEFCKIRGYDDAAYFFIHKPFDSLFSEAYYSNMKLNIGVRKRILVIPSLVTTDKILENYQPTERGCFFSHERELSMFKHYSESNCKTECTTNCSLQICGCVPYFLPQHNTSVDVCLEHCVGISACDCGCLPDCNALSYEIEVLDDYDDNVYDNRSFGAFSITYKTRGFYATNRVSLTNQAQFIAYSLGIFGVFNGFSVMMIFEVFYFLIFKLWHSVKSRLNVI